MNFTETEKAVTKWAQDRLIIEQSSVDKQLIKLLEEYAELVYAVESKSKEEIIDAIGDMVVVLTIISRMNNTTVEHCYESAYNEIKNRKGTIVNGLYVKE